MLFRLEQRGVYAEISGFRGVRMENAARIADVIRLARKRDVSVQFLNAELIATWEHLYFALLNAIVGFENHCNISRSIELELMLYACAQRQIQKAIDTLGIKRGCVNLAVVIIGHNATSVEASLSKVTRYLGKELDDTVLELSEKKTEEIRRVFGISETELEATTGGNNQKLVNLVIERMALLSTSV